MGRQIVGVLALLCFAVALLPQSAAAASFTTSASASPAAVTVGTATTIKADVRTDTAMTMLVNVDVYSPSGQKVFQKWWDGEAFAAGQNRSFSVAWTPTSAEQGAYSIQIGLFAPGWATTYHWNSQAGQLAVSQPLSGTGGTGLSGQYFDTASLTTPMLTRTDPTVNFDFGTAAPAAGMGADTFSARWQGKVAPRFSETYTFYTISDDGVRLWVNGRLLVDNWTNHAPTENKGTVALVAGQQYDLKLEYYDSSGGAQIRLSWSSPSQAKEIVPQSQLFPSAASPAPTAAPATASPLPTAARTAAPLPTATRTAVPATATPAPLPSATVTAGGYFRTLPPGSALPSDAQCAAAVKRRPENKGMNAPYNATRGSQKLASSFFNGTDPRANTQIAPRVTGDFTGTTDEILQWAACKWGVDEDMVRAQAVAESWWEQTTKGDWTSDPTRCPPNHGLGVDGRPGLCPESYGILQNRYPYQPSSWPGIDTSTAFNADTAYALWRSCYEGYDLWLNQVEQGQPYVAGDAWGCFGRWFAGRWYTQPAKDYITKVQGHLKERTWELPTFQEP